VKFQVEIHLFDFCGVPLAEVENLVKQAKLLKEAISTQIRLGLLLGHYVVFIDGVSLKSEGDTWGGPLVSKVPFGCLPVSISLENTIYKNLEEYFMIIRY
jgi:hypothetical protein